ncbi:HAD-IB family hydrolase [Helicobacter fennelliae]|uniref:Phosphoserine phosphatase n=1 Tax=Helicobacter fennelliae MRY12-0050 TaxID=1325130 RepID=T1DUH8_9HELI|nr:HAD-IB family hydrolase [Helicobacter fennelliae]GAD17793.1 phosphoserine phosphatase [Helicobacter fennelliae MRY12-0050]STP07687.1 phosphoserine phosphatase [Helicobacter fennelliae]STQ84595.1 phosphoserine phosphatase [Helicobacter fennelliae]
MQQINKHINTPQNNTNQNLNNKKILALFDFCETLVDFQSAARYLELVAQKKTRHKLHNLYTKISNKSKNILRKFIHLPPKQQVRYEVLKGLSVSDAQCIAKEFVTNELLPRVNPKVIERLQYHQRNKHTIVIVSGGFEIYIKLFAQHFGITHVVAVALEECNGYLSGNIDGIHTMEHRKLYKLIECINVSEFDLQKSYAYSDCSSDIPLLSFVGHGIVIECGKDTQWANILGFEIL